MCHEIPQLHFSLLLGNNNKLKFDSIITILKNIILYYR